jgi:hypothetical protein
VICLVVICLVVVFIRSHRPLECRLFVVRALDKELKGNLIEQKHNVMAKVMNSIVFDSNVLERNVC